MWISEADTAVVRFLAQPHRLEIRVEGKEKPLYYFPDLLRRLEDGTIEIIEVKQKDEEIAKDSDYDFKLAKAKSIYAALGWKFRVVVAEDELEIDPIAYNTFSVSSASSASPARPQRTDWNDLNKPCCDLAA
jgi:hypothetical protein